MCDDDEKDLMPSSRSRTSGSATRLSGPAREGAARLVVGVCWSLVFLSTEADRGWLHPSRKACLSLFCAIRKRGVPLSAMALALS